MAINLQCYLGVTTLAKRGPRRQYAALPSTVGADGQRLILLVTSRETRRWVLPKGWAERGVSPHDQAAREAFEEAGVEGEIGQERIGSYRYLKRLSGGRTVPCRVDVYPLAVDRLLDDWPEKEQRELCWFTPSDAAAVVEESGLIALLLDLAARDA